MSASSAKSSIRVPVVSAQGGAFSGREDFVATEEPLEIQVSHLRGKVRVRKSVSVTMRTPGHDAELAAGFLFTEGMITQMSQVKEISIGSDNLVRVIFYEGVVLDLKSLERHFYTTSSCGVCGKTSLAALQMQRSFTLQSGRPRVRAEIIHRLPHSLREAQRVFDQTGGLHAAALFDKNGELILVREDVGRHNAVDKVIGAALRAGREDFSDLLLFVSGRTSFELMQKTLMAGIPVLAAVGAPSSLAVELARRSGATLIGFVRDLRFNIYAGADRLAKD